MSEEKGYAHAAELADEVRSHLADLLLVLADNKRLLGIRYSDWILGAPSVEAGIACSAMAQDEWGHGRIVYAMLKDFGLSPDELEHERPADEYRNSALLDRPASGWPELIALNLLLDTAISVQFEAMRESRFEPVHYKVRKLLEEERFHFEHGRGWTARLATTGPGREALNAAFLPAWRSCLGWFGPTDDPQGHALADAGVVSLDPQGLRARWRERIEPVLATAGLAAPEAESAEPSWDGWNPRTRRGAGGGGPDPDTLARVRGDRNRSLLMD